MSNNQNEAPPSVGSHASFASAQQDDQDNISGSADPSPNNPRILFDHDALPPRPSYLTHFVSGTSIPFRMEEVEEEAEDCGLPDDDSVEESAEAQQLTKILVENYEDRQNDDDVLFNDENAIRGLKKGVKMPEKPEGWTPRPVDPSKGEPDFNEVDNPGNWSRYCFRPNFQKRGGQFVKYQLPTLAQPCPLIDGVRKSNGWVFFYEDWQLQDAWKSSGFHDILASATEVPVYRSGATSDNVFPEERKGNLDYQLLHKMGLSKKRLLMHDPLFFYQLLLPICRIDKSDIQDDPRKPYYSDVAIFTQKYAFELGLGGSYGHEFKQVLVPEMLQFDGILMRDGVLGGSVDGGIHRRWKKESSCYDSLIANTMSHTRFLQLKRTLKLNDNSKAKKAKEDGYDPAYKYDMIYATMCHNVRALTQSASLDLCADETSWAHQGFGERGSGLLSRIFNKPGITKGGQTVMLLDAYRCRPYWYVHRHKCHNSFGKEWTKSGQSEVRMIMEGIAPFVNGSNSGCRTIWSSKPHTTWDNHFSGDLIMEWLGNEGYATTMTCRRDRLPDKVPIEYFHHHKTTPGDKIAKYARFQNPITAVKIARRKDATDDCSPESFYTRVHVSMQSTSSTNFTTVNALNQNFNSIRIRERGREAAGTKRTWGIEMNDARELYLKTYGVIDTMDSQINRACIYYRSYKYWHSPKNHALAMAVTVAYDLYKECFCEEKAHKYWNFTTSEAESAPKGVLSFMEFREKLALQATCYNPSHQYYPGDKNFRSVTQMSKKMREEKKRKRNVNKLPTADEGSITIEQIYELKKIEKKKDGRFCGDLSRFRRHIEAKTASYRLVCAVCGKDTWTKCGICGVGLHDTGSTKTARSKTCFIDYHDSCMFGLCRSDSPAFKKDPKRFKVASDEEKERHRQLIQRLSAGGMSTRSNRSTQKSTPEAASVTL